MFDASENKNMSAFGEWLNKKEHIQIILQPNTEYQMSGMRLSTPNNTREKKMG